MTTAAHLEAVIGLEIHAQILTESKMFCRCSAQYAGAAPNTHVCAVCGGMPGALPVINRKAVEGTMLTALALHCSIHERSHFDRKNYPYPDLPKGYQITQYARPLGHHGWLAFPVDGREERCGIVRVHLEEDTGKLLHISVGGKDTSLVDYNRSGVPLMEIVTEPDLRSPLAARQFFASLRQILMYIGVNDGNLQEGSLRADVNVSLRSVDGEYGTKVEIKNLNSFRAVQRALEYEIERQRQVLEAGGAIEQETRGWLERDEVTVPQRSKEYAHDYRYFPEPDLPPLVLSPATVHSVGERLPELPTARVARLVAEYDLTPYAAAVLAEERERADFFEQVARRAPEIPGMTVAHWVTGDLLRLVNVSGTDWGAVRIAPDQLAELLCMIEADAISGTAAKTILETMITSGDDPNVIAQRLDLMQITDIVELERIVDIILGENPRLVESYRRGKTNVLQALVGKAMKASGGKADPQKIRTILDGKLGRA
jgi:aspartyl-tRNA(Asn)/glutamyl-tRNA(Gln) amidotransferase subunit B